MAAVLGGRAADTDSGEITILSGCEVDYPPYCIVTEDNQADGFSVELLRASLKTMGRDVTYKTGEWTEIMQDLVEERLQVLPLVGRTPEREALFDFSFPYLTMHGTIIVRTDNTDIQTPADLNGKHVAVMRDDNSHEYLQRANLGALIEPRPTFDIALRELSAGQYDAVVIQKLLAYQLMDQSGLTNLKAVGLPLPDFTQSFCFAVRKGDSALLAILNEGLAIALADGTYRSLHSKWLSDLENATVPKTRLVFGGDHNSPPYEYLDANGQPAGFNVELMRAVAKQSGLPIDIRLGDWQTIRSRLASGEIDGMIGMPYSAEREREYSFSPAYAISNQVIAVRNDSPELPDMKSLAGKKILVQAGDILEDLAVKLGYQNQLVQVDSQEEALRQLAAGKGDCALVARLSCYYWIEKNGWKNLRLSNYPVLSAELCFAVPHNREKLLYPLIDGLAAVEQSGEYRKIQAKWLGPYEEQAISWRTVAKYVAVVALPMMLLLGGSLLWSRSLRQQVSSRTRELAAEVAERHQTASRLQLLFDNMQEGFALHQIVLDPDGKPIDYIFLEINERFKVFTGLTDGIIGKRVTDVYPGIQDLDFDWIGVYGQVALTGEPAEFEQYFTLRQRWYRLSAFCPITHYFAVLFIDITERKQMEAEKQARDAQLRQQQKLQSIGTLASGVAHEINNPINGVMNYAELIKDDLPPDSQQAEYCREIIHETERVATIVRNLLSFSRSEKQSHSPAQMNDIIDATLSLIFTVIRRDQIEFILDVPKDLPQLKCRSQQIQQVLMNLLTNARDALNERYPSFDPDKIILLTVSQYEQDGRSWIRTTVEDHGNGIPIAVREKIFDPFYTTKDRTKGTGLGLSISHGIVEAHHGHLIFESEPGRFTRVHLDLPIDNGWQL